MSSFPTQSSSASKSADTSWFAHLTELSAYQYLLYNLVVRDLKVRYKNSVLGILWSLLNPLLMMLVFTPRVQCAGKSGHTQLLRFSFWLASCRGTSSPAQLSAVPIRF